jgi:hypothetical protein
MQKIAGTQRGITDGGRLNTKKKTKLVKTDFEEN